MSVEVNIDEVTETVEVIVSENVVDVAAAIAAAQVKENPVLADVIGCLDSEDGGTLKQVLIEKLAESILEDVPTGGANVGDATDGDGVLAGDGEEIYVLTAAQLRTFAQLSTTNSVEFLDLTSGQIIVPTAGEQQILLQNAAGDFSTYIGTQNFGLVLRTRTNQGNGSIRFDFGNLGDRLQFRPDGSYITLEAFSAGLMLAGVSQITGVSNTPFVIISDDAAGGSDGIILRRSNRTPAGLNAISVWEHHETEVARMTTSGRLGIGTTTPQEALDVAGSAHFSEGFSGGEYTVAVATALMADLAGKYIEISNEAAGVPVLARVNSTGTQILRLYDNQPIATT